MKIFNIYIVILVLLVSSCINDKSDLVYPKNNANFSEIEISSDTDTLSIDLGQKLEFTPNITMSIEGEASYQWFASFKHVDSGVLDDSVHCGNNKTLSHIFTKPGEYNLNLEVKNKDYKEVKTWLLKVRNYDEGYMIVGNDEATNKSTLSFARILSPTEILEGKELKFSLNLFEKFNPEYKLENVIKICKSIIEYRSSSSYLHIITKEKIYVCEPSTFKLIIVLDFTKEYPGEYITGASIEDTHAPSTYLSTSKGRVIQYQKAQLGFFESTSFIGEYDKVYTGYYNIFYSNLTTQIIGIKNSKLYTSIPYFEYYGGSNPANNTMVKIDGTFVDDGKINEFEDYNIINLFTMNGNGGEGQNTHFYAIGKNKSISENYKVIEYDVNTSNAWEIINEFEVNNPICTISEKSITPNGRYNCAYYFNDNKIYLWYPSNIAPLNKFPNDDAIDLGEGKEVTLIKVSHDMREIYVGFIDNNSSEEYKGGMYIYNASDIGVVPNLKPTQKFENITSRPIDIIYKSLSQDNYIPAAK